MRQADDNPDAQCEPARAPRRVDARQLWSGGAATAVVAALIALVGILVCRWLFKIPILAPQRDGAWGAASTVGYVFAAAAIALFATAIMHLLLISTPRPRMFFGWIIGLGTVIAVVFPFSTTAPLYQKVATGLVNLVLGVAIGTLVSGVSMRATRRRVVGRRIRAQPPPTRRRGRRATVTAEAATGRLGGRSRWLDLDGPVHYLDFGGPAEGPLIVGVHGLGGAAVNWSAIAPLLTGRYRLLAPDLSGHGLTWLARRGTGVRAQQMLLDGFLAAVATGPVILMGNSMGGMLSLLEAAAAPKAVAGLILIDPVLPVVLARLDPIVAGLFVSAAVPGLGRLVARAPPAARGHRGRRAGPVLRRSGPGGP